MANLGKVVYLSEQQKKELFANNTITVDGVTINYSDNDIYATPGDDTSLYCTATLSSAGWYRVMKTKDVSGTIINFYIGRPWDSNPAEAHKISFYTVGSGKSAFIDETSDTNTLCVDKIRATYCGGLMYFDVHYNASSANEVLVYFDVYGKGQANGTSIAMGLASVADAPSGETVVTTYNFVASTQISGSVAGSYGTIYYNRKGDVCSIYGDVTGVPTGAWTTLATGLPAPAITQFFVAQNGSSNDFVMCQLNTSGTLKFYGRGSYSSGYPTQTYICN